MTLNMPPQIIQTLALGDLQVLRSAKRTNEFDLDMHHLIVAILLLRCLEGFGTLGNRAGVVLVNAHLATMAKELALLGEHIVAFGAAEMVRGGLMG